MIQTEGNRVREVTPAWRKRDRENREDGDGGALILRRVDARMKAGGGGA